MPVRYFSTKDIEINSPQLQELGYIYNFDFQPSLNGGDTGLVLNIINREGIYDTDLLKGMMSFQNYFKFDILGGAEKKGITLYAYLVGYTEEINAESKTLKLDFKDGSHILDRVFVALLNKEIQASGLNSIQERQVFTKKILCNTCNIMADNNFTSVNFSQERILHNSSSHLMPSIQGQNVYGNSVMGGIILVGKEKFTKSACEIPDTDFNFTELKIAARRIGVYIDIPDLFPFFRVKTGGTLKEVLTIFANRFGFSYRYNFGRNPQAGHYISAVEIIHSSSQDLSVYRSINELKDFAKNYFPSNKGDPIVTGISDSESISETKENYTAIRAQKNTEEKARTRKVNYFINLVPVKIRDILSESQGRTEEQLMISAALRKYSSVARDLYNVSIETFSALGLFKWSKHPDSKFLISSLSSQVSHNVIKAITQWQLYFEENKIYDRGALKTIQIIDYSLFDVYLAHHSSHAEAEISKFEDGIVNFLGKYYYTPVTQAENLHQSAGFLSTKTFTSKITPEVKEYDTSSICRSVEFPFGSLMEDGDFWKNSPLRSSPKVSLFSRSPSFAGDDKFIKKFLETVVKSISRDSCGIFNVYEGFDQFTNPLDIFKPIIFQQSFQISAAATQAHEESLALGLTASISHTSGVATTVGGKRGVYNAVTVVVPSRELIKRLFEISSIQVVINDKETDTFHKNNEEKIMAKDDDNLCAIQENPIDYFDQEFILDPVTKAYAPNPCYCGSAASVNYGYFTGNPKKEAHAIGLINDYASSFIIKLGNIFGASSENFISTSQLGKGELRVVLPCGTLLNNPQLDYYAANYEENFTQSTYIPSVLSCANNFVSGVQASSINVFSDDISGLAFREYSDPKVYSQWNVINKNFPLEIQNPNGPDFISFWDYFLMVSAINKGASSIFPRKELTLRLSATDNLGDFARFMDVQYGLSSCSIEKGENSLSFVIKFQNKHPVKLDRLSLVVEEFRLGREF